MKLTIYICNICGTIMQMDELPAGWQRGPVPGLGGSTPHYCKSCAAEYLFKQNPELH